MVRRKFPETKKKKKSSEPVYDSKLFPEQAYFACSELGALDQDLAKLFNVTDECIRLWKRNHPEFNKRYREGVEEYGNRVAVINLRKRIEGFTYDEVKTEEISLTEGRGKNKVSLPAIKTTRTTKFVIPDVGAIAFWLKNKMKDEWKDYKAVEVGNLNGPMKINVTLEDDG